ncbi:endonuclease/exonuclease/phosphatase family protein [Dongia sp.]|uniref:endonuclease/exonuclease/phosphatase family protein n=1 Tax=Dongia sp. TaxID=1977262 RepID=UPI0035B14BFF
MDEVDVSEQGTLRRADMPASGISGRRRISSWLHGLLSVGALGLAAAALMPLFHPLWPLTAVAEHFALQILAAAILLVVLALALRCWRWLALVLGIALIQVWIIHPYWPGLNLVLTPMNNEARFKIVSLNVFYRGDSYQSVRDYLAASGADVIGLVEVTPRWKAELAPLRALYPYGVDCLAADQRCEEMLLSKHPFTKSGAARIDQRLPVLAWGEIALPGRKSVTIAVTHLVWPLMPAKPAELATGPYETAPADGLPRIAQAEQAAQLLAGLARLPEDAILMGDFNAAPWSRIQQDLRMASGFDNAGFMVPSWPAWGPALIRLPIDHIMARGQARVISLAAGPDVGSDHLPVEAIVSLAQ